MLNQSFKIITILIIFSLVLPAFSFAQEQSGFSAPQTVEEAKNVVMTILSKLPDAVKQVWREEAVPILRKTWVWFFEFWKSSIWPALDPWRQKLMDLLGQEIEKRRPAIEEEIKKEVKENIKETAPVIGESLWGKVKDLLQPPENTPESTSSGSDLDVLFIERSPMYYSFHGHISYPNNYPQPNPSGYENKQQWPKEGEPTTFTAHIKNTGAALEGSVSYQWKVNNVVLDKGTITNLGAGDIIKKTLQWNWQSQGANLEFIVDSDNAAIEISENNNSVKEHTDALSLYIQIEDAAYDYFKNLTNKRGSKGFDDWIRIQVEELAGRMQKAALNGKFEKLRLGKIEVFPNGSLPCGGMHAKQSEEYDGVWGFQLSGYTSCQDAYPKDFFNNVAQTIDEGLQHELGHQLGLIDNYAMDVAANNVFFEDSNLLPKAEYCQGNADCPVYYTQAKPSLMHGASGQFHAFDKAGLYAVLGKRRGYFGDYLFNLPQTVKVKIVDESGNPINSANMAFYQRESDGKIKNFIIFSGFTDNNGIFTLPNRQVCAWNGGVCPVTYTDHQLKANPFGQVLVHGGNGALLIQTSKSGITQYNWLDISQLVTAYFDGYKKAAIFSLKLFINPINNRNDEGVVKAAQLVR